MKLSLTQFYETASCDLPAAYSFINGNLLME